MKSKLFSSFLISALALATAGASLGQEPAQDQPASKASRSAPKLPKCSDSLPGLAVPVGSHGKLRTGVQIMSMRNREDLCLDAGEVIEAAEGVVMPIDPAKAG